MNHKQLQELQRIHRDSVSDTPVVSELGEFNGWTLNAQYQIKLIENDESEALEPLSDEYGTYTISFGTFQSFVDGLAKVNAKAAKLGVPPLEIASKNKVLMRKADKDEPAIYGFEVKLKGEPVRVNGWEFLASVQHHGLSGNNLSFVPGMEDKRVKDYANASNKNCDFCHSNRDRNNTYIVRSVENGELKQVGGQCLQKYIGDAARKLAKFAFHMDEFVGGLTDGGSSGSSQSVATDAVTAVAAAIAVVDKYGFKRSGEPESTASIVGASVFGYGSKEFRNDYKEIISLINSQPPELIERAEAMLKWFGDLPEEAKESSYMISLDSIINSDVVTPRTLGLISSLPAAHKRATVAQAPKEDRIPSEWVGEVGGKIPPTEVTVTRVSLHDGAYGTVQLVAMKDDKGNDYSWWNSSNTHLDADTKYTIVGKVKKHEEYKGQKKTVLSHVKIQK